MKTVTHKILSLALALAPLALGPSGHAATVTVTSTADSGAGSLRDALASAANGDTIDASSVTGTITLTTGELVVSNSVTILGPGPGNLAVNGNAASHVFHIMGSNTVAAISSLTISNGLTSEFSGGGIFNESATLTVSNCTLSGNSATDYCGGGIYNVGTLTVTASTLSSNSAAYGGGGIHQLGRHANDCQQHPQRQLVHR